MSNPRFSLLMLAGSFRAVKFHDGRLVRTAKLATGLCASRTAWLKRQLHALCEQKSPGCPDGEPASSVSIASVSQTCLLHSPQRASRPNAATATSALLHSKADSLAGRHSSRTDCRRTPSRTESSRHRYSVCVHRPTTPFCLFRSASMVAKVGYRVSQKTCLLLLRASSHEA